MSSRQCSEPKKPEARPPLNDRLICSACGCRTNYKVSNVGPDVDYDPKSGFSHDDWLAKIAMCTGANFIAFCDFCCDRFELPGGSVMFFGECPFSVLYVTGYGRPFDAEGWRKYVEADKISRRAV